MSTVVGRESRAQAHRLRVIGRLLAIGAAAALSLAWVPAGTAASSPSPALEPALGDWPQVRHDPSNSGYNPDETVISASNVAHLRLAWTARPGGELVSPPIVASDVVYASSGDNLYAYAAGCARGGAQCKPLWKAPTGPQLQTPAVADGLVYDAWGFSSLAAYSVRCARVPTICQPSWTALVKTIQGSPALTSPAIADGVVYVGTITPQGSVIAYPGGCDSGTASCATRCPSGGEGCTELWRANTAGPIYASPAIAGSVVYVGADDGLLYAFDAEGCAHQQAMCTPLWTASTGTSMLGGTSLLEGIRSSPVVANGVVYVASSVGELYAFAAGCASGGRTCTPLWTARARNQAWASSPAVANGVVYFTGQSGKSRYANLNAYDAGCASGGETCTPLWTAFPGVGASSPTVANGVVYVTADHEIYAYAVGCATGGKICDPLWTATTGGGSDSSPVIANGAVYVASLNGGLYAFSLDGATPPATSTATSQPLTEPGAPNGILALGLVAFLAGTMLTLRRQQRHTG